jgi:hypothetical protein
MATSCPSCNAGVPAGARFCAHCGAGLAAVEPAASADPLRETLETAIGFQYRIVRLLGRGGMGAVYLAHELALDREVAIKVLLPGRSETPEARERFRREARTAARLAHPNIVPLLTFGEVRGLVYYVMGYVRGESLAGRLRRDGSLSPEQVRRISSELADALDHAHRNGVVHRDLKPDNVLLDEESGRALLADFGIAKAQGLGQTLTATGSLVGTPHYMSPEQAAGKGDVDGRSDLYSLGVMAYEMLAGVRPFEGQSAADVLVQHMTGTPPALSAKAETAPPRLVRAIERCLAKDPSERWPDARAFREEIAQEESAELPDALRTVHAMPSVWLLYAVVMWFYGLYQWLVGDLVKGWQHGPLYEILDGLWKLLPLISTVAVVNARRERHSWPEIRSAALRQPSWWLGFYPRRHRVPGDVWDRLPLPVRRVRALLIPLLAILLFSEFTGLFVLTYGAEQYARTGRRLGGFEAVVLSGAPPLVAALFAGAAAVVVYGQVSVRRLKRRAHAKVDWGALLGMTWTSTTPRSFWSRPGISPLLEALPGSAADAATRDTASPAEIEASLSRRLDGWPDQRRTLSEQVRAAARDCRDSIDDLDRQIESLRRDLDPDEGRRLGAKLAGLGDAREGEPDERRQLRELLARQLELQLGLEGAIAEHQKERDRKLATLRRLRDRAAAVDGPDGAAAEDRLRHLCLRLPGAAEDDTPTRTSNPNATSATPS